MDYINGVSIKSVIETLARTEQLLNDSLTDEDCYANESFSETETIGEKHCYHCQATKSIEQITNQINSLQTLLPNTLYHNLYVDAYALKEALEQFGHPIGSVFIHECWNDETAELNPDQFPPDYYKMEVNYSRYTMDGNGYHVGYEDVVFVAKCIPKSNLKLHGIPYKLSPFVVNPDSFEIESKSLPPEELSYIDSHDSDCEVFKREEGNEWNPEEDHYPDDCTCYCNDFWNGYFPPDDDFFETEIDQIISSIIQSKLPVAEYNKESNEWSIGNQCNWKVGDPPFEPSYL